MRFAVLFVLVALTGFAHAAESYVSQKGEWIRNKAETKIPADGFKPIDTPMVVSKDDGTELKFTIYVMTNEGLQPGITFEGAYDGRAYPFGKGTTLAFTHVSPNSFRTELKSADGSSQTELVTFIANNTKMRFEGKRTEKTGKTYEYVEVWDKMQ
ncbi:MAG: hypothetical protein K2P94_00755 [Rhodospirillaceae bacterium]|nr:hypothetical protein [Rhodospirillaceae bacterium]